MKTLETLTVATRIKVLLLAVGVMLLAFSPAPVQTDAAWTDTAQASAGMGTITLPEVTEPKCQTVGSDAVITWNPPSGGLPAGMRYKVTLDNIPARPNTQGVVYTKDTTHTYAKRGLGHPHPNGTILNVKIFAVIDTSTAPPGAVEWSSSGKPTSSLTIQYVHWGKKYSCQ
ncbi:hypothetical protein ACTXM3_17630 [Glutamicibacter arilaitensis]|uniref:Hypothetical secreted protein n=1 Tax=Glutamicibacter arilaitensis (strain DSM 16368 / CIP 108037 / IAM 15318 / JCM 13566 / NCIMB 14258 / Re117) TaxID=861360 RepID=A0ABP1U7Y7_GLUAR|nr:hypothetical protein [Glutamicibacter arilaitensis]CBT77108.1 hypothetical secreted protein [Glutamicibacter arilaitensis Re117]